MNVWQAVVLAAGKGSRLGGITEALPKPMIPIRGKPILEHTIERLTAHGVREIFINLYHHAQTIQIYFRRWRRDVHLKFLVEPQLSGTAGAVKRFQPFLHRAPFFVVYGDNYFDFQLHPLMALHEAERPLGTIGLYRQDDVRHSGIAVLHDDGRILQFIEKPKTDEAHSHLINTGIYLLEPGIFDVIPNVAEADFGRDVFPSAIAKGYRLYGVLLDGMLLAVDTPDLYRAATRVTA